MSKKVIAFKFCLVCIIILENGENVLVLKVKFLIVRFIVLLTSCSTPKMLNILVLIGPINLANIETFGLLCHIFYTELMVRSRVFDALYYLSLFSYRTTYSNWRLLNLARGLSWPRFIAIYFLLRAPFPDFLIVMVKFLMPF
jgi:hypothetical protein